MGQAIEVTATRTARQAPTTTTAPERVSSKRARSTGGVCGRPRAATLSGRVPGVMSKHKGSRGRTRSVDVERVAALLAVASNHAPLRPAPPRAGRRACRRCACGGMPVAACVRRRAYDRTAVHDRRPGRVHADTGPARYRRGDYPRRDAVVTAAASQPGTRKPCHAALGAVRVHEWCAAVCATETLN